MLLLLLVAQAVGRDQSFQNTTSEQRTRRLSKKKSAHVSELISGEGEADGGTHYRAHSEGIVKEWLKRGRQPEDLATKLLDLGGFACWVTLVQLHLQVLGTNFMRADERKKLLNMCYPPEEWHVTAAGHRTRKQHGRHSPGHGSHKHGHAGGGVGGLLGGVGHHGKNKHHGHHKSPHNATSSSEEAEAAGSSGGGVGGEAAATAASAAAEQSHANGSGSAGEGVICNRQHNGLGNQMFQYVFSRLVAESLGRDWTTRDLIPGRGETPWNAKGTPPNTETGWAVFNRLFAHADKHFSAAAAHAHAPNNHQHSPAQRRHRRRLTASNSKGLSSMSPQELERNETWAHVETVCSADFRDTGEGICRISDRPYDVRLYKKKMLDQFIEAFFGTTCSSGCVYTIGYFQETIYFLPERQRILSWFHLPDALAIQAKQTQVQPQPQTPTEHKGKSVDPPTMPKQPKTATAKTAMKPVEELTSSLAPPRSTSLPATTLSESSGGGGGGHTEAVALEGKQQQQQQQPLLEDRVEGWVAGSVDMWLANTSTATSTAPPPQWETDRRRDRDRHRRVKRSRRLSAKLQPEEAQVAEAQEQQLQGQTVTWPSSLAMPPGFPKVGVDDLSLHVRCCEPAGMCKWLFMPWGYYDTVLERNAKDHPHGKVWIITTHQCAVKPMVASLLAKWPNQAQLVHPPDKKHVEDMVADDFRFLMNSPRLLLGKSTFGFWAGYLSPTVREVHMPVDPKAMAKKYSTGEKIPFAFDDPRYVHHAWEEGKWFGTHDSQGKLVYQVEGVSVVLDQIAPAKKRRP